MGMDETIQRQNGTEHCERILASNRMASFQEMHALNKIA